MKDTSLKIVGFEEKSGVFKENPWHNIYFHCTKNFTGENKKGSEVSIVKVKYDVLTDSFNKALTFAELSNFIDKHVEFMYNKDGSVIYVIPAETKSDEKK
ncbi:MAG: hypothetical protein ACI4VT_01405 [Bacilli bacterium]